VFYVHAKRQHSIGYMGDDLQTLFICCFWTICLDQSAWLCRRS